MNALIAIFLITAIVGIHETAHAIAARRLGFKIQKICIGLPISPKVTFKLKGVHIILSPWLLGGGVVMDDDEFYSAPFQKKALVAVSGPIANVASGLLAAIIAFGPKLGIEIATEFIKATIGAITQLFTGQVGINELAGPVGIVKISSDIIGIDPAQGVLFVWLLLSFAVGAINLLPIPALDGGQILVGAFCSLMGNSPRSIRIAKRVNLVFLIFLLGGIFLLTIKDIHVMF